MITGSRPGAVLVLMLSAAMTQACESKPSPARTVTAPSPAGGDPASWHLAPGQSLTASSTGFTALVSRMDCNGGVTGQVLPPAIRSTSSEIVVTFTVAAKSPGPAPCQGNNQVPYEVELGEPLRGRALVDGLCGEGGTQAGTAFCEPTATRYPVPGR